MSTSRQLQSAGRQLGGGASQFFRAFLPTNLRNAARGARVVTETVGDPEVQTALQTVQRYAPKLNRFIEKAEKTWNSAHEYINIPANRIGVGFGLSSIPLAAIGNRVGNNLGERAAARIANERASHLARNLYTIGGTVIGGGIGIGAGVLARNLASN